mgnify:CR=1 FL=1
MTMGIVFVASAAASAIFGPQKGATPKQVELLRRRLERLAQAGYDKPIYVRADGKASYEVVAQVMAALSTGGFTRINLITDTGGPSSGESQKAATTEGQSG